MSTRFRVALAAAALAAFVQPALSHGGGDHDDTAHSASAEEKAFGREGDPKNISRNISIDMSDAMRFAPAQITVKQGETIRFRVKNSGKTMHEMVLGTMQDLKAHAETMRKDAGMHHHGAANIVHVAPGKTAALVWQFTNAGEFHYGCLVPGHFEAGMVGRVRVLALSDKM
jgi:uncharacterized cupredoxin-like copper-binding protein